MSKTVGKIFGIDIVENDTVPRDEVWVCPHPTGEIRNGALVVTYRPGYILRLATPHDSRSYARPTRTTENEDG